MKTTIKNFLFKKRFKVLKSKKGFSLMEVMVAVGIIGLVSAFALPQYADYQRTVRFGIVRSILSVPYRTAQLEESMGEGVSNLSKDYLWNKIHSDAKGDFDDGANSPKFTQNSTDNKKWCFFIKGKSGSKYEDYQGCVDDSGADLLGGDNVPCDKIKGYRKVATPASTTCDDSKKCPTGCKEKTAFTATCAASDTAGSVKEVVDCIKDTQSQVNLTGLTCNNGACSR